MPNLIDLTDRVFDGWTVIERAANDGKRRTRWKCRCECGAVKDVYAVNLLHGKSKRCASCGARKRTR